MYCIESDNELRMTTCNVALLCMAGLHPEWSEIGGFQQYLLNCINRQALMGHTKFKKIIFIFLIP